MIQKQIPEILNKQREFFNSGKTKVLSFRIEQLEFLKKAILENEEEILSALSLDIGRSRVESYMGEIGITLKEINYAIKNLKSWAKPKRVSTPFILFLASSWVYHEPFGVVLIISPWNYPFRLIVSPLIGAISAGNCAILKPSEVAVNTSNLLAKIFPKYFVPEFIKVIEGGVETTKTLLAEKFDYIFFTGGIMVGKIIMEAASRHLTPLTLELGGKSPCIVDRNVNIEYSAKRIVWGKFFNAGQSCTAPDYVLVDRVVKKELVEMMKKYIKEFYGDDPSKSVDYAKIINKKHFLRLRELIQGNIVTGGEMEEDKLYIAPTIIDNVSLKDKIMQEEIFGPILPVIEFEDILHAISIVNKNPKPLALYLFSKNKENQERILRGTSSGGVCINDTMVHVLNIKLPFGGVGDSGMGSYVGKSSFDTFSHKKAVVRRTMLFDFKLRYPPYKGKYKLFKRLI